MARARAARRSGVIGAGVADDSEVATPFFKTVFRYAARLRIAGSFSSAAMTAEKADFKVIGILG